MVGNYLKWHFEIILYLNRWIFFFEMVVKQFHEKKGQQVGKQWYVRHVVQVYDRVTQQPIFTTPGNVFTLVLRNKKKGTTRLLHKQTAILRLDPIKESFVPTWGINSLLGRTNLPAYQNCRSCCCLISEVCIHSFKQSLKKRKKR